MTITYSLQSQGVIKLQPGKKDQYWYDINQNNTFDQGEEVPDVDSNYRINGDDMLTFAITHAQNRLQIKKITDTIEWDRKEYANSGGADAYKYIVTNYFPLIEQQTPRILTSERQQNFTRVLEIYPTFKKYLNIYFLADTCLDLIKQNETLTTAIQEYAKAKSALDEAQKAKKGKADIDALTQALKKQDENKKTVQDTVQTEIEKLNTKKKLYGNEPVLRDKAFYEERKMAMGKQMLDLGSQMALRGYQSLLQYDRLFPIEASGNLITGVTDAKQLIAMDSYKLTNNGFIAQRMLPARQFQTITQIDALKQKYYSYEYAEWYTAGEAPIRSFRVDDDLANNPKACVLALPSGEQFMVSDYALSTYQGKDVLRNISIIYDDFQPELEFNKKVKLPFGMDAQVNYLAYDVTGTHIIAADFVNHQTVSLPTIGKQQVQTIDCDLQGRITYAAFAKPITVVLPTGETAMVKALGFAATGAITYYYFDTPMLITLPLQTAAQTQAILAEFVSYYPESKKIKDIRIADEKSVAFDCQGNSLNVVEFVYSESGDLLTLYLNGVYQNISINGVELPVAGLINLNNDGSIQNAF